jgi:hypothetical protein
LSEAEGDARSKRTGVFCGRTAASFFTLQREICPYNARVYADGTGLHNWQNRGFGLHNCINVRSRWPDEWLMHGVALRPMKINIRSGLISPDWHPKLKQDHRASPSGIEAAEGQITMTPSSRRASRTGPPRACVSRSWAIVETRTCVTPSLTRLPVKPEAVRSWLAQDALL